jgi:hypothetical protein
VKQIGHSDARVAGLRHCGPADEQTLWHLELEKQKRHKREAGMGGDGRRRGGIMEIEHGGKRKRREVWE